MEISSTFLRTPSEIEFEKDDKSKAYENAVKAEEELRAKLATIGIEFNRYRALAHVDRGTYVCDFIFL